MNIRLRHYVLNSSKSMNLKTCKNEIKTVKKMEECGLESSSTIQNSVFVCCIRYYIWIQNKFEDTKKKKI